MDHFGTKSKDKSRLLKFQAEFVSYYTPSNGPYSYRELPREYWITEPTPEDPDGDIEDEGYAEIFSISVKNKLVDFSKKEINFSNWNNLKFEEELKNRNYLFEDQESIRKFKDLSMVYSIDIGNRSEYLDNEYEVYGSSHSTKLEPLRFDNVTNAIPSLQNGIPKDKMLRTKTVDQFTEELSDKIFESILDSKKSIRTLLDEQLGIEVPVESYPDFNLFWEDILESNYEEIFDYLDASPKFRKRTPYVPTKKNLEDTNYWKWETNPNFGIPFSKQDPEEYSFLAIERLSGIKENNLSSKEVTVKFLNFIFDNIFQLTKTIDGKQIFKFLSDAEEAPSSLFTSYSFSYDDSYKTNVNESDQLTHQDYFDDLNTFVNSDDFNEVLDIAVTNFVLRHGLTSDELVKIYEEISSGKVFQNIMESPTYFKNSLKELPFFTSEPIIISSKCENLAVGKWGSSIEDSDYFRDLMIQTILNQLQKIKYIGPLRQLNIKEERNFSFLPNAPLGTNGEQFFNFYEKNKRREVEVPIPNLTSKNKKIEISKQQTTIEEALNAWLKYFEIADAFGTEADIELDILKGYVVPKNLNKRIRLDNLGVGFSQLAPIILLCISSDNGDTILLEQPELHLHPAVQQKFANFALAFAENGIQIILETHSDHLVNRLRRELVESSDNLDKLISIYFVERKEGLSKFTLANVDKFGQYEFNKYPEGFFDQTAEDSLAILKARAKLKEDEQL